MSRTDQTSNEKRPGEQTSESRNGEPTHVGRLTALEQEVATLRRRVHELETHPVSGLPNRHRFDPELASAIEERRRLPAALDLMNGADPRRISESSLLPISVTLAAIDLAYLRYWNGAGGHAAGDRALRQFAHAMQATVGQFEGRCLLEQQNARTIGMRAYHIGGDEFALLVIGGNQNDAARALRTAISAYRQEIVVKGQALQPQADFGCASLIEALIVYGEVVRQAPSVAPSSDHDRLTRLKRLLLMIADERATLAKVMDRLIMLSELYEQDQPRFYAFAKFLMTGSEHVTTLDVVRLTELERRDRFRAIQKITARSYQSRIRYLKEVGRRDSTASDEAPWELAAIQCALGQLPFQS